MPRPALIAITMARKPVSEGSIAANALRHGTGPINIEATRIASQHTSARWPANLVVQHTPPCKPDVCDPSCAVADLDGQDPDNRPGSQFFLNLPGDGSNALPDELIAYLRRMVTADGGSCVVLRDLEESDLSGFPSDHHHAAIVRGEPTPEQAADLLRTLRPGGHLFVAAPEHRPTGHVGACRVEDAGFEVRDCILWVRDAGHAHYVAKASTSEREAGLSHLPFKEVVGGEGDSIPTRRRNTHPTVKPKTLMGRLLQTVPTDLGPVIDPFMGSGTTLLACLDTGHDGIGIERELEYIAIADARIRHWDHEFAAWDAATIVSDYTPPTIETVEMSVDDFLGL